MPWPWRTEMRAAARLRPVDQVWPHAARAGLAVGIPLVTLVAAGHTAWAATATFGAFTALYARDEPYSRRAVQLAVVAVGLIAAVTAGGLAALAPGRQFAAVIAVAAIGAAATAVCTRARVGPPGGLMFAFAAAVSSAIPAQASGIVRNAALCAAAAAVAWLISMAGALVDPAAPRRLAIARALRAAAALSEAPAGPAGLRLRHQAAVAVEKAWRTVPLSRTDEALLVAHAETELSGVRGSEPDALRELAAKLVRKGPVPAFPASPAEREDVAGRLTAFLLRSGPATRRMPWWPTALRVGAGALIAGACAQLSGIGHPYWAAVSAVAVLQATSLRLTLHRAAQRTLGTVAGLLIAASAVALPGDRWTIVAEIAAAQVIAELLVVRNYGLAMLAVTPLALLVGELAHPAGAASLIEDRLAQTAIGCGLGLLCALLIPNKATGRYLETTLTEVESAPAADEADGRRLVRLVLSLREAYEVASGEPGLSPQLTERVLHAERAARRKLAALTPVP